MLIYLVRHLATKLSQSGIYMGRSCDLPILEGEIEGFRKRLARLFPQKLKGTTLVLSSPSLRCRQTAKALKDVLGSDCGIRVVREFSETDYGEFEGKHFEQIKREYPDLYFAWMNRPSQVTFPNGESFREVQDRSFGKLVELGRRCSKAKRLFVVTHVDVIKMIVSRILAIPIGKKRYFRINCGSFSCLESKGEKIRVKYLNCT